MEVKFTRTFTAKDGKYTAGEINLMLGRAMEIIELRPALTEGKLGIGEICVMLFGITPEEYALKDSDPKAFDALAASLRKNVPADRLIGLRVTDLKGTLVKREIKLKTGASIDDGAFAERMRTRMTGAAGPIDAELLSCAKLQKLAQPKDAPEGVKQDWERARQTLGAALMRLEKLTVADDALTGSRFPSVGFDGRVELFTTPERANRVQTKISEASENLEIWTLRTLPQAEFAAYFRRCMDLGMPSFRVDNGFAAAELNINDILSGIAPENAMLRGQIVRDIEYGMRWKNLKEKNAAEPKVRGALESMLTFRNFAWRETGNAVLYAACIENAGDGAALCTQAARAKLDPEKPARIVSADKFMVVGDPSGKRNMAVFTSRILAAAFAEKREENAEPVAVVFDDLKARMRICDGIVIDPETFGYRIPADQMDKVLELRVKPPLAVRIQPPPQDAPPQPKPAPEMGGLPDPDAVSIPTKTSEPAPEPVEPAPETKENPAEKKGFFRKLFGKQD